MIYKIRSLFKHFINPNPILIRKYSQPALIPEYKEDKYLNIKFNFPKPEFSYVCPLCNGSGIIPCKLCKDGCLYCGYSNYVLCRCQLDV